MSEIKTKIRTYNDVIDLFGEEKAADMLSEALDWSTIDPKNDKKNIMERKPLLLDPYMTYEGEDYCKHIVAGFLGDRDLDWASGYIDEEKIKNGQVMPADLKSALSMALDNELSTSWAYLDALSSQCAEIFNKFAEYIESAGLASGVLNPGGRPFAVTEPILHRLQSSAKLCARAGTTTQFTRMTVNQWFDKAERSQRSPLGRSVDIGRAASALNSQHEHAEVPQDLTK